MTGVQTCALPIYFSLVYCVSQSRYKSEIKVNESIANKNNAESQTTIESRPAIVENLNQMGIGKYLENTVNEWKISGNSSLMENLGYNGSGKGLSVN